MAAQKRSNNSAFTQEPRAITQVALYARVSTLNNQDPEMQLSELRDVPVTTAVFKVCPPEHNHQARTALTLRH